MVIVMRWFPSSPAGLIRAVNCNISSVFCSFQKEAGGMDQSSLLLLTEKHKDHNANYVDTEISLLLDESTDSEVEVLEDIRTNRRSQDNSDLDITILYENHSMTEKQKLIKSAIKNRCYVKIEKMKDAAKYLNKISSHRSGSLVVGGDSSRASKENSSDNLIEYEQRVIKTFKNLFNPKRGRPFNIKPKTEKEKEAYNQVFEKFEANLNVQDGTGQTLVDLQAEPLKKSYHSLPLLPKPLPSLSTRETWTCISKLIRMGKGGRKRLEYGNPAARPCWWPQHILTWEDMDTKRKSLNFSHSNFKKVLQQCLAAGYQYFGCDPTTYYVRDREQRTEKEYFSAIEDRAREAEPSGVATDQVQVEAGKNLKDDLRSLSTLSTAKKETKSEKDGTEKVANEKSGEETIEISSHEVSDVEIVEDMFWDSIFEENNNDIRLKRVRVLVKNEATGISAAPAPADRKRKFQADQASVNIKADPIKPKKKPSQFEDPKKLSDFEKIREKNIKEREALFASLNFDVEVDELKKATGLKKKIDQSIRQRSLSSSNSTVVTRKQLIRSKARESDGHAVARKEEHSGENLDKLETNSGKGKLKRTIVDVTSETKDTTREGLSGKFSAGAFRIPKVKKAVVGCMSFGDLKEDALLWEIVNNKEVIGQKDAEELKRINNQYSRLTKLMEEIDPVLKLQTENEKKIVITDEEEIADLLQIKEKLGDDIDDERRKKLARESFENEEQSKPQRNLTFHGFQKEVSKLPKSQTEYVQMCEEATTEETPLKITDVEKVMKKVMKLSYCLKHKDHLFALENLEKLRPLVGHFKQGSDETATFLRFYSNAEKVG